MTDSTTYSLSEQNQNISSACIDHMQRYLFTRTLDITGGSLSPVGEAERFEGQANVLNLACDIEILVALDQSLLILCARPQEDDWLFGTCFPEMPGAWQDKDQSPDLLDLLAGLDLISLQTLPSSTPSKPGNDTLSPESDVRDVLAAVDLIDHAYQSVLAEQQQNLQELPDRFFLRHLGLRNALLLYVYTPEQENEAADAYHARIAEALNSIELWQAWTQDVGSEAGQISLEAPGGLLMMGNLSTALPKANPFAGLLSEFLGLAAGWSWSSVPAVAMIDDEESLPSLAVQLALVDEVQFGPAAFEDGTIGLSSPLTFAPGNSQVKLQGTIEILDTGLHIEVDVPLDGDVILASATLVDGDHSFFDPDEYPFLPPLTGDEAVRIEVAFSQSERKVDRLTLSAHTTDWDLLPDPFRFRELAFAIMIYPQPDGATVVMASLVADVLLGETEFAFSGFYPAGPLTGSLLAATPLKLRDLGSYFDFDKDLLPDLIVDELSFSHGLAGDETTGVLHIQRATAADDPNADWPHEALQDLRFFFRGPAPYNAEITALLHAGGVMVTLSAVRSTEGWHFEGSSVPGETLKMMDLIGWLDDQFGTGTDVPTAISTLTFEDLVVVYDTGSGDFSFRGNGRLQVDEQQVQINVDTKISNEEDDTAEDKDANSSEDEESSGKKKTHKIHFDVKIIVGSEQFKVTFDDKIGTAGDDFETALTALYEHDSSDGSKPPDTHGLVAQISPDLAEIVPPIPIQRAFLGYYSEKKKGEAASAWLFGLEPGSGLDMNFSVGNLDLPVVSALFSDDLSFGVTALQLLLTTHPLSSDMIAAMPNLDSFQLPEGDLQEALFSALLKLGDEPHPLLLPLGGGKEKQKPKKTIEGKTAGSTEPPSQPDPSAGADEVAGPPAAASTSAPLSDNTTWITIQKRLGPLYFQQVGVRYKKGSLGFLLQASLTGAGVTLSLDGFSIDSPLHEFSPSFDLSGIGIGFKGGAINISGAFLKSVDDDGNVQYTGEALITAESYALTAFGAYASVNGSPSLFIFAMMDEPPLGGPPFFFVTGLALGFGYNRDVRIPTIDEVKQFPFVSAVMPEPGADLLQAKANDPMATLAEIDKGNWLPKAPGQNWLAVGVRFTSFEMMQSFALATIKFGTRFEVAVLGMSQLTVPPPEPGTNTPPPDRMGYAEVVFSAVFIPDEGILRVDGKLTSASYVLVKEARLTGGFAFYVWFDGDFVISFGGYHPDFDRGLYPDVPRLGVDFFIGSSLHITMQAYFALTPAAVMAGGDLKAVWDSGPLKAWYNAGADFLLQWKPFLYEAHIWVNIGASFTLDFAFFSISVTVELGADLSLWGPPLGGTAHISYSIASFTIGFGADKPDPDPLTWPQFRDQFLPVPQAGKADDALKNGALLSVQVTEGLVKDLTQVRDPAQEVSPSWVVNSANVAIEVRTAVPATGLWLNDSELPLPEEHYQEPLHIGPMRENGKDYSAPYHVLIEYHDPEAENPDEKWQPYPMNKLLAEAILGKSPKALWSDHNLLGKKKPLSQAESSLENTVVGIRIWPKAPEPDETPAFNLKDLLFEEHQIDPLAMYEQTPPFARQSLAETTALGAEIAGSSGRDGVLEALRSAGIVRPETVINLSRLANDQSALLAEPRKRSFRAAEGQ